MADRLEPLLAADGKAGAAGNSFGQSAVALFKAVVGVGVFALPPAMRLCGWALGSLMLLLLAAVSMHTAEAMIEAVVALRKRGVGADSGGRIEFQEVTRLAFPRANGTITLLCVIGQFGSVMSFFAFVIDVITPLAAWLRPAHVCAGMAAVVGPIALLRTTSHPAFQGAMVFGNVSVLAAIATILACAAGHVSTQGAAPADELHAADLRGAGLTFGVSLAAGCKRPFGADFGRRPIGPRGPSHRKALLAWPMPSQGAPGSRSLRLQPLMTPAGLFTFACQMEAVSIEQDMAARARFPAMLRSSFAAITALFGLFGLVVYAAFGEATGRVRVPSAGGGAWAWREATVMQNLPSDGFVLAVKLAMALNLCFMAPITLLPGFKATEDALGLDERSLPRRAALRLSVLAAVGVASLLLPDFELVTGLIGVTAAFSCFIMPAACHLHFCNPGLTCWQVALDRGIVVFGTLGALYSVGQVVVVQCGLIAQPI